MRCEALRKTRRTLTDNKRLSHFDRKLPAKRHGEFYPSVPCSSATYIPISRYTSRSVIEHAPSIPSRSLSDDFVWTFLAVAVRIINRK